MTRKPPPRRKTDVSHITACDAVQRRLIVRYGQLGTWKAVGGELGVSGGMAQRVAMTEYRPRNAAIRKALGLPALALTTVCECGEVHLSKRCPNKPRPPVKPRTKWKSVAQDLADALEPARLFVAYANFEAGYPGGSYRSKDVLPKIEAALARAGRISPPVDDRL